MFGIGGLLLWIYSWAEFNGLISLVWYGVAGMYMTVMELVYHLVIHWTGIGELFGLSKIG